MGVGPLERQRRLARCVVEDAHAAGRPRLLDATAQDERPDDAGRRDERRGKGVLQAVDGAHGLGDPRGGEARLGGVHPPAPVPRPGGIVIAGERG